MLVWEILTDPPPPPPRIVLQRKATAGAAEISIDPEALEGLSQEELQARYDQSRTGPRVHVPGTHVDRSEFTDVIEQETAKRTRGSDRDREKRRGKEEKFKF